MWDCSKGIHYDKVSISLGFFTFSAVSAIDGFYLLCEKAVISFPIKYEKV